MDRRVADAATASMRRGPNGLKLDKETTPGIVRWPRVDGVTLRDGTPRAHQLERVRDVDALREVLHVFPV